MRFTAQALLERGLDPASLYLSLERNMKCAVTHCGRCQLGPAFLCREGPVMSIAEVGRFFGVREL